MRKVAGRSIRAVRAGGGGVLFGLGPVGRGRGAGDLAEDAVIVGGVVEPAVDGDGQHRPLRVVAQQLFRVLDASDFDVVPDAHAVARPEHGAEIRAVEPGDIGQRVQPERLGKMRVDVVDGVAYAREIFVRGGERTPLVDVPEAAAYRDERLHQTKAHAVLVIGGALP